MPPGTSTPSRASRVARATPKKVASGIVAASESDEERKLTDTPSRSATNEEETSGSLGVSWSEKASGSAEVRAPTTAAQFDSFDEADSLKSTPGSPTCGLTLVVNQSNRWCVNGQYQDYSDAKFLNDEGVMTRTLEFGVVGPYGKSLNYARDRQSLHQTSTGVDNSFVWQL